MDTDESPLSRAGAHPDHDDIARALRARYTTTSPEFDYVVTDHWFGHLSGRNHPWGLRLVLTVDDAEEVPRALAESREALGDQDLTIWVEGRDRHHALDAALRQNGCTSVNATTHLALVGALQVDRSPMGVDVRDVGAEDLTQWAQVKLRCFDDTEEPPSDERLASEIAVRRIEVTIARLRLAVIDDEPVGVLAHSLGPDQLAFVLGTRIPFRHRGVAQALLARSIDEAGPDDCRSFVINARDPGAPQELYRRMGFVDEVYWHHRYLLSGLQPDDHDDSTRPRD